jgi:hypothetical protein
MAASGTALTIDMETFEKLNGFDELFDSGGHCTALRCTRRRTRAARRPPLCSDPNPPAATRHRLRSARTVSGPPRGTCAACLGVSSGMLVYRGTCKHEWHLG